MQTTKKTKINGKEEVIVEPQLANLILELNKKLVEAKKLNHKILKMISEQ
jgi:hypothetical protein